MSLRIQPNSTSLRTERSVVRSQQELRRSYTRLASGDRLTNAGEDAPAYAQSLRLRAEVRALQEAARGASDGLALTQTAEGALSQMTELFQRMRELAMQGGSGTLRDSDRARLQAELSQLRDEADRIASTTRFGDQDLLSGGLATGAKFTIGASGSNDTQTVTLASVRVATLGTPAAPLTGASLATQTSATAALESIDAALQSTYDARARMGIAQARFQSASDAVALAAEGATSAKGRIRDVDVARETAALAQQQIQSQAGIAMLAQANQLPEMALALLRR